MYSPRSGYGYGESAKLAASRFKKHKGCGAQICKVSAGDKRILDHLGDVCEDFYFWESTPISCCATNSWCRWLGHCFTWDKAIQVPALSMAKPSQWQISLATMEVDPLSSSGFFVKIGNPKVRLEIDCSDMNLNSSSVSCLSCLNNAARLHPSQESVQSKDWRSVNQYNQPTGSWIAGCAPTDIHTHQKSKMSKNARFNILYILFNLDFQEFLARAMPCSVIRMLSSQQMIDPAHTPGIKLPIGLFVWSSVSKAFLGKELAPEHEEAVDEMIKNALVAPGQRPSS